jgi:hypothetical protein
MPGLWYTEHMRNVLCRVAVNLIIISLTSYKIPAFYCSFCGLFNDKFQHQKLYELEEEEAVLFYLDESATIIPTDTEDRPPLWSRGLCSWLQKQRSRVRFPALPDVQCSRGSGTGSTQPRGLK